MFFLPSNNKQCMKKQTNSSTKSLATNFCYPPLFFYGIFLFGGEDSCKLQPHLLQQSKDNLIGTRLSWGLANKLYKADEITTERSGKSLAEQTSSPHSSTFCPSSEQPLFYLWPPRLAVFPVLLNLGENKMAASTRVRMKLLF